MISDKVDMSSNTEVKNVLKISNGGTGLASLLPKSVITSDIDGNIVPLQLINPNDIIVGHLIDWTTIPKVKTLTCTFNQVNISDNDTQIILSTPQDIDQQADVNFKTITTDNIHIKKDTNQLIFGSDDTKTITLNLDSTNISNNVVIGVSSNIVGGDSLELLINNEQHIKHVKTDLSLNTNEYNTIY